MASPNVLEQRIDSLMDATRSRTAVNRSIAIGTLVAITMTIGAASVLRPSSMADKPENAIDVSQ